MKNIDKTIIGREVFTLDSQLKVRSFKVDAISTFERKDSTSVTLYDTDFNSYDADKVFPSKRELLDHIMS